MKILYIPNVHTTRRPRSASPVSCMIDATLLSERPLHVDFYVTKDYETAEVDDLASVGWIKEREPQWERRIGGVRRPLEASAVDLLRDVQHGRRDYDVVLCNAFYHYAEVHAAMFERRWGRVQFPYQVPALWLVSEYADPHMQWPERPWARWLAAAAMATDHCLTFTEMDRRRLLRLARELLTGPALAAAERHVHGWKPPVRDHGRRALRVFRRPTLTFTYVGTHIPKMRTEWLLTAVEAARARGFTQAQVLLTSPRDMPKRLPVRPWIRTIADCTQARFLDAMLEGDVFFHGADYEGTGLSFVQQSLAGLLGLYLHASCLSDRVPAGYPFMAKTRDELTALVLQLCAWHRREERHVVDRWRTELQQANQRRFADAAMVAPLWTACEAAMLEAVAPLRTHFAVQAIAELRGTQHLTDDKWLEQAEPLMQKVSLRNLMRPAARRAVRLLTDT